MPTITIDPVTRIEGHAKVCIHLDDAGVVQTARLHVNEFRGFEKFCEGRPYYEMPLITERICGICPVSHHLASVKACDMIYGAAPPRTAAMLRELMHMGQLIQSHSMHFFHLAGPDLLLGFDADPAVRNVAGLAARAPDLVKVAIALRRYGQQIIACVGDRRIHPNFAVPGGVNKALAAADRNALLADLPRMIEYIQAGLAVCKEWVDKHRDEVASFASFPTMYLGMVGPENELRLYDGAMRLVDADGTEVLKFDGRDYLQHIAEHVENWSYLKFPYYKARGWPQGVYRVGPLGRLNACAKIDTPLAQKEFEIFRQMHGGKPAAGTLVYHYARLIEDLHAAERAYALLADPFILGTDLRAPVTAGTLVGRREGVGVIEAPRGTLWHHYWVNDQGILEKVNLIVATGNNNYAMSHAVETVAKTYVKGNKVPEGALNRIEAAIRAYDPCLSCSTHALGKMPLAVEVFDARGQLVGQVTRS